MMCSQGTLISSLLACLIFCGPCLQFCIAGPLESVCGLAIRAVNDYTQQGAGRSAFFECTAQWAAPSAPCGRPLLGGVLGRLPILGPPPPWQTETASALPDDLPSPFFTVGVCNPTAILGKVPDLLGLKTDLLLLAETSAVSATQHTVQGLLRKAGFRAFWSHTFCLASHSAGPSPFAARPRAGHGRAISRPLSPDLYTCSTSTLGYATLLRGICAHWSCTG